MGEHDTIYNSSADGLNFHSPLLLNDRLFRLLVDQATDYAIFVLSPSGEVATWNHGAERIKGFKSNEIIGRHFRIFYPPEAQAARIPEEELRAAIANGRFEAEGWRIRGDGSRFWANVIITPIRDQAGQLIAFSKVTRDLTERKHAEEQLRELSHALLKLQDEERGRLGRELHDTVGQNLAAAKMSLDAIASDDTLVDPADARHRVNDVLPLLDCAIRQVRTLSYLLYPPMLEEMGLGSAIRWHLEEFSKRSGIQTICERCDKIRLPKDTELALFRIFQESLINVHRHSQSPVAHIRFFVENGTAILEVSDRGVGLPPTLSELSSASLGKSGVGVRSMHERISQVGGRLSMTSSSNGTVVTASVPLEPSSTPADARNPHS